MKVLIYVSKYEEIYVVGVGVVDVESNVIEGVVVDKIEKDLLSVGEDMSIKIDKGKFSWSIENEEGYELGVYEVIDVEGV